MTQDKIFGPEAQDIFLLRLSLCGPWWLREESHTAASEQSSFRLKQMPEPLNNLTTCFPLYALFSRFKSGGERVAVYLKQRWETVMILDS